MAKSSCSHVRKIQIEQIQTKLKTLSIVNQHAFLIKDSGEALSGDDSQRKEIFDCIDVSQQLIGELSMMLGVFDAVSDVLARGAGAGGLQ